MDFLTANDQPGVYPASYYAAVTDPLTPFPVASGDLRCDVCVIGGGFTGLSSALHLAQRGFDVILLEAQRVGFGASGRNGGQLGHGQRQDQIELEDLLGKPHAQELWDMALEALDTVRNLAQSDLVHTDVHDGVLHANHKASYDAQSRALVDKLQSDYGYDKVRHIPHDEMQHLVGSSAYSEGMLDMGAGHLNPLAFAIGLARMAEAAGVRIFEQSRVIEISETDPAIVKTTEATITSQFVVLGCNGYLGHLHQHVANKVMPINNFIVATEPLSPEMKVRVLRENYAVADSKFVVNYFRFSEDDRLLFGGSESYSYRFPQDIAAQVRKPMLDIFPQLKDTRLDYAWGGTLGITLNRLPHFEQLTKNILSLSGYSGHGVGTATWAGKIAAEVIAGQAEKFDIMARIPTPNFPGGTLLRSPLLVLAMLWYSLRDKL